MLRRLLPGLLFALALAAGSCKQAGNSPLAGLWAPHSAELGGQELPISSFGGATLRLTKDAYEFAGDQGTYTVLSTSPPARMDIRGGVGPNAGRTIQAIYELEGDLLAVCYQLGPGERPTQFKTESGTQVLLVRYKRVQ